MKNIIAAICAVMLIASLSVAAFAEPVIVNGMKGDDSSQSMEQTSLLSGAELIRATGDQDEIVMPNYRSYFNTPTVRYIDAEKNHSIYVYKGLDTNINKPNDKEALMPFAHEGLNVLETAQQDGMSCIVYRDRNFRLHAGWVESKFLTSMFPGRTIEVGNAFTGTSTHVELPTLMWSKYHFVGTNQKYAVFSKAADNCVQLKLAYQVTDTDGERFDDMLGQRTVYVNNGKGWIQVGQFEYSAQGAVLVTVNLENPEHIEAVAIIASCNEPDHVIFRIELQDLRVES